jgi:predicted nucleic acid-binding protein
LLVIDASATIAMLLDEKEHLTDNRTFDVLTESALIAPGHWPAEVGNALLMNVRRGRLSIERLHAMVERLAVFRVAVQHPPQAAEIESRLLRALKDGLTYYDALYVELAVDHDASLFSLDEQMRQAAAQRGVSVLPA